MLHDAKSPLHRSSLGDPARRWRTPAALVAGLAVAGLALGLACVPSATGVRGDGGTPGDGGSHRDGGSVTDGGTSTDGGTTDGGTSTDGGTTDGGVAAVCGDGICNGHETATSCSQDCAPCAMPQGSLTDFEKTLITLPPDSWYQAPSSHLRPVCVPDSVGVRGVTGCAAVVSSWSGGAFDAVDDQMLVWGGGHNDYWGNEVYAFDLHTGTWSRLTEPSTIPAGTDPATFLDQDPLPDGKPDSRHTYDGLSFIRHAGVLFAHGGSRAKDGYGTDVTWAFDPSTKTWRDMAPSPEAPTEYGLASAYDPTTGLVFLRGHAGLFQYDYDHNAWTKLADFGNKPLWPRYAIYGYKVATVDTKRHLLWSVGNQDILVWDIAASKMVTDDWVTTGGGTYSNASVVKGYPQELFQSGGGTIYNASAPGFDYDSAADAMVAWPNQGSPYALDLATKTWTQLSATGAPVSQTSGGTFGRWRYIPRYNVFILVNSIDENVYFYKFTGCGG